MRKSAILVGVVAAACAAEAAFTIDRSAMSDAYWRAWNDAEQAKIDADIEANRKADGTFAVDAPAGTEVTVEQLDHEFRFGAHIFNYDQLGKREYNDAYKASYGRGGLFNQATVAFYWKDYEPVPGRCRAGGDYEDTERFWNSLTREEAMDHPYWRRPAPMPVISFLKGKDVAIHGHILIWGLAKPDWIYDCFCPEAEKRAFDEYGIPRHSTQLLREEAGWTGGYNKLWREKWQQAYSELDEAKIAAMAPVFTRRMRELFRERATGVATRFGEFVDSFDIVNESSLDQSRYGKSRTGLPVWKSSYGLMPGDYPLHALLDAKAAFPAKVNLAINDYNIAGGFLDQVKDLESEGAKIDIVGCQMHIFDTNACMRLALGATNVNWVGTPQTIQDRLDMMAKTGKRLHVSEITITSPGADERSRMIQAVLTRNIYRKWFSHKAMMGITWWNTVDGGGVKGEPLVSGLFTRDMRKKPAYLALDQLINHEWRTETKVKVEGEGEQRKISFRGFRGRYRLTWKDDVGLLHAKVVNLTGENARDDPRSRGESQMEQDVPAPKSRGFAKVRVYGPVDPAKPLAKTAEDVAALGVAFHDVEMPRWGETLDVGKVLGVPSLLGREGEVCAYVVARVACDRNRTVICHWKNDWFGELSVNGRQVVAPQGPVSEWGGLPVKFRAGENVIVFRTRGGSAGKWICDLALTGVR